MNIRYVDSSGTGGPPVFANELGASYGNAAEYDATELVEVRGHGRAAARLSSPKSHATMLAVLSFLLCSASAAPRYAEDFERTEIGKVPANAVVLSGGFAVREFEGNRVFELPDEPLGSYGVMLGPADSAAADVRVRVWADNSGRRFPEFGIGIAGAQGYKLFLLPGQGILELRKADDPIAHASVSWQPHVWTWLRLRGQEVSGKWTIEAKAWTDGTVEPPQWMVQFDAPAAPTAGRASIWGIPHSGKPIRFDDVSVE